MPVSERQLAEFADKHAWRIPFDTSPRHLGSFVWISRSLVRVCR